MGDITRNKHRNNPASVAAYERSEAHHATDREKVFCHLVASMAGMTSKEIAASMDKPLHVVSGRCTELKKEKWIRGTGVRRDGAEVMVACAEMEKTA